jgi:hypothetical protein
MGSPSGKVAVRGAEADLPLGKNRGMMT